MDNMPVSKRIPVSEERWKELHELKKAGQTYDELLEDLIREHNRKELMEKMSKAEEMDEEELEPLDEL